MKQKLPLILILAFSLFGQVACDKVDSEIVFREVKFNQDFKRFRMRSHRKVSVEFGLIALAHNLMRHTSSSLRKTAFGYQMTDATLQQELNQASF